MSGGGSPGRGPARQERGPSVHPPARSACPGHLPAWKSLLDVPGDRVCDLLGLNRWARRAQPVVAPQPDRVTRRSPHVVMSRRRNRQTASARNTTVYAALTVRPSRIVTRSTGNRNRPVYPSHPCVGRNGWIAWRLGIWSAIWLAIATITVATIAPGPESVSVEIHMPTATIPDAARRMTAPEARILTRPSITERDVPESVGIGWIPNTTPPANKPEQITISSNVPVNVIAAAYFDTISLGRRTGRTSR